MRTSMRDRLRQREAAQRLQASGYPFPYLENVRRTQRGVAKAWLFWCFSSLLLCYGYFHNWDQPVFSLALPVTAIFLLCTLSVIPTLNDSRAVCILPYFKKGTSEDPHVEGDTFLHGKALARNCLFLDKLAQLAGLQTLSYFGFRDDLAGETPVWYDAAQGLRTVSGLLHLLEQQPYLLEEANLIQDDLGRLEASLQSACALQVPFCLLLRQGNCASGHEMDVRAGYFTYGH